MPGLVTSDQFITGVLAELAIKGRKEIKLVDTQADEKFEQAYNLLVERMDDYGVEPDFSLMRNPYHGDSEILRETLYAIRERGVVAINNPSFRTIQINIDEDDAEDYLSRSPLPQAFFEAVVTLYFEDKEAS